jgi:16S rRNA (cytidine1402-2'-O)-methyltransferase
MSDLYIVSTPIGNLKDITFRAIETLKKVDLILCEDTRITKKLLDRYDVKARVDSYHQHSKLKKTEDIIKYLEQGKNIALVSDAGTPGISDPGNKLIKEVILRLGDKVKIIAIPGPSAVTAIASISGFPTDKFLFLGFPPVKKKRKKYFQEVVASQYPVIFYESRYRILKTLDGLKEVASSKLEVVIGRELTKKFETIYRGKLEEIIEKVKKDKVKGEFVVIVNK